MKLQNTLVVLAVMTSLVLAGCTPADMEVGMPASALVSTLKSASTAVQTETAVQAPVGSAVPESCLKNATYLIEGQSVTLVDGAAETESAPGSASTQVTRYFGNAVESDLNADGLADKAFLLQVETGGSGTFYYAAAALTTIDGCAGTNAVFLGDRIAPQSTTADPSNPSWFTVNYADRNPGEPMSAPPSLGVSRTFRFENGALVEAAGLQ